MVKRTNRTKKAIESLRKEIEIHFKKIDKDILEGNLDRGRYHIKEIDKSLLATLELKMKILGITDEKLIEDYKKRLEDYEKELLS